MHISNFSPFPNRPFPPQEDQSTSVNLPTHPTSNGGMRKMGSSVGTRTRCAHISFFFARFDADSHAHVMLSNEKFLASELGTKCVESALLLLLLLLVGRPPRLNSNNSFIFFSLLVHTGNRVADARMGWQNKKCDPPSSLISGGERERKSCLLFSIHHPLSLLNLSKEMMCENAE